MAFSANDFDDFVNLLNQHPEWRPRLLQAMLTEEFLALPAEVRQLGRETKDLARAITELYGVINELAGTVRQLVRIVTDLAASHGKLVESQAQTQSQLVSLAESQAQTQAQLVSLAESQAQTQAQLVSLAESQAQTQSQLSTLVTETRLLTDRTGRIEDIVASVNGDMLEFKFERKAPAILGRIVRRVRVVPFQRIEEQLESHLTEDEVGKVALTDYIIRAVPKRGLSQDEVWLAIEISSVVDTHDVDRAEERAGLLRSAGFPAIPVVVGVSLTSGADFSTRARSVVVIRNGSIRYWDEALQHLQNQP